MKYLPSSRPLALLVALLVVIQLGNLWLGIEAFWAREQALELSDDLADEQQTVRRLRGLQQLSATRQELEALEAKLPPSFRQPVPPDADTLKLFSDLINARSSGAARPVAFKASEPKSEIIGGVAYQILGLELGLQGSAQDVVGVLRRIDESSLVSLKAPAFTLQRQDEVWTTKLDLALYLVAPVQPTPTPTATPPPSKPAPTPTPKPR